MTNWKAKLEVLVELGKDIQAESSGPDPFYVREARKKADRNIERLAKEIEKAVRESAAGAVQRTLDQALNSGSGIYKP
jgi:hypothetical protein